MNGEERQLSMLRETTETIQRTVDELIRIADKYHEDRNNMVFRAASVMIAVSLREDFTECEVANSET